MDDVKKKPNILFLMSDEHRFDISGFSGNSIIRTPCLDELAKDAVVFTNAYTPAPICIPARQCIAAGQYPKTCGVERYGEDLPINYQTFAKTLSQVGYETVAAGKLHHFGIDQMQGWRMRIAGDCELSSGVLGPGMKWDEKKEILRAGPGESVYARKDKLVVQGTKDFIYQYFVDSYYDRATPDHPLLLYVGLLNPHYPYIAEQRLFDYYLNRVEPYENQRPFDHPFLGKCANTKALIPGEDISLRDIKRAMAAYYANIETIDSQFEDIVKSLKEAGQNLDDWIIIYTSDHGEMLGEHAIWEKQRFFEGSVKVPLFIRYPKKFRPKIIKKNVNLIDLFATLCELTETEIPTGLDSRSLVPLLDGNESSWENETISQFNGQNIMIKKENIKYQWYEEDQSEVLFDLEIDSTEKQNLVDHVRYQEMLPIFRNRRDELGFGFTR